MHDLVSRVFSASNYLSTYLSRAINNSTCGRFLWLWNEERTAAACSNPAVLYDTQRHCALSRRGRSRIARYNGPLHNGIRTCDIPGGRVAAMLRTTPGVAKEAPPAPQVREPLGTASRGISHMTRFSCIKAPVVSSRRSHIELRYRIREIMWILFLYAVTY